MIRILGPHDGPMHRPHDPTFVNTTSHSRSWGRGLSPFLTGPIPLYKGAPVAEAKNAENAWQYSKVYSQFVGEDGNPDPEYFKWAKIGYLTQRGVRYPMGKGAKPKYAWWAGEKLGYVESRLKIYLPCYGRAVAKSEAFQQLQELHDNNETITLWDFDGYDHEAKGKSLNDVAHDDRRPLGHAFVLKILLTGEKIDGCNL